MRGAGHPLRPDGHRGPARTLPPALLAVLPLLAVLSLLVLAAAACTSAPEGPKRLKVVATTPIMGEVVSSVVGQAADVEVVIPRGVDTTTYRATDAQRAALAGADLIVANGLGAEAGLDDVLGAARTQGRTILEIAPRLNPRPADGTGATSGSAGTTPAGGGDPHVWLDPDRMTRAAKLVAEAVGTLPGTDRKQLDARAEDYGATLARADEAVQAALLPLPDDARNLVTDRDSLGYFAERYGLNVVVPSVTEATVDRAADSMTSSATTVVLSVTDPASPAAGALVAKATAGDPTRRTQLVVVPIETLGAEGSPTGTVSGLLTTLATSLAGALGQPAR